MNFCLQRIILYRQKNVVKRKFFFFHFGRIRSNGKDFCEEVNKESYLKLPELNRHSLNLKEYILILWNFSHFENFVFLFFSSLVVMHIGKVLCFQFHFEGNTPLYYTKENIEVIDSRQGIEYYYYYHFQDLYHQILYQNWLQKLKNWLQKLSATSTHAHMSLFLFRILCLVKYRLISWGSLKIKGAQSDIINSCSICIFITVIISLLFQLNNSCGEEEGYSNDRLRLEFCLSSTEFNIRCDSWNIFLYNTIHWFCCFNLFDNAVVVKSKYTPSF